MRVLMLSNLLPPDFDGGYEISARKAAEGMRERGVDVEVATSRFRPGFTPVPEEPWIHRVFGIRMPILGTELSGVLGKVDAYRRLAYNEGMVPENLQALRRLVKGKPYDVAYVFGLHNVGLGITKALTEQGIPILWHFGDHYLADRQGYWDTSATYRLAAKTTFRDHASGERGLDLRHCAFISQFLLDYYRERNVPLGETTILPRGIEYALGTDVERPREEPPVILMAGRLSPDKGFHNAIEAVRLIHERRPDLDFRLRIVGGGDDAYFAELQAAAQPLGEKVEFWGKVPREKVVQALRDAAMFVSASVWGEPFGRTIIEAMGAGTPVVGSIDGAMLEIVVPDETALVFPKHDPAALAEAIERMLDDPALRMKLARNSVERVARHYTMDAILDRTERLLERVAADRKTAASTF